MSKDSSSRKLLGTIKFVFDKTKSRTLNATQAYDTSPSQIVLGSFPASATKKNLAKRRERRVNDEVPFVRLDGVASATLTANGGLAGISGGDVLEKANLGASGDWKTASVSYVSAILPSLGGKELGATIRFDQTSTVTFGGTDNNAGTGGYAPDKSNAVKDIFYGAIIVGTGLYREWQGKYAVLKVDPLTNKAILRVYNE